MHPLPVSRSAGEVTTIAMVAVAAMITASPIMIAIKTVVAIMAALTASAAAAATSVTALAVKATRRWAVMRPHAPIAPRSRVPGRPIVTPLLVRPFTPIAALGLRPPLVHLPEPLERPLEFRLADLPIVIAIDTREDGGGRWRAFPIGGGPVWSVLRRRVGGGTIVLAGTIGPGRRAGPQGHDRQQPECHGKYAHRLSLRLNVDMDPLPGPYPISIRLAG